MAGAGSFAPSRRETRRALAAVYASKEAQAQDWPAVEAMKKAAMDDFRQRYATLRAGWTGPRQGAYDGWVARANNAMFAAQAAYDSLVPGFEALFEREGQDWPRFYAAVKRIAALPKAGRGRHSRPGLNRHGRHPHQQPQHTTREAAVPDIHIERKHTLGIAAAREVARQWLQKVERDYALECSYDEGEACDVAAFTRPGIDGSVEVTGDSFVLQATLGVLYRQLQRADRAAAAAEPGCAAGRGRAGRRRLQRQGSALAHLSQLTSDFDDFGGVEQRKCLMRIGLTRQNACGGDLGPWRAGDGFLNCGACFCAATDA